MPSDSDNERSWARLECSLKAKREAVRHQLSSVRSELKIAERSILLRESELKALDRMFTPLAVDTYSANSIARKLAHREQCARLKDFTSAKVSELCEAANELYLEFESLLTVSAQVEAREEKLEQLKRRQSLRLEIQKDLSESEAHAEATAARSRKTRRVTR